MLILLFMVILYVYIYLVSYKQEII